MTYPEYIEVNGERYKLDTSYRTAIKCFEILEDETITDSERAMALMVILLGKIVMKDADKIIELLVRYLQRGSTKEEIDELRALSESTERDIDYAQDLGYITASFMSDYQLDLSDPANNDMHWWKFVDLLNGINPKSAFGRVRELRNMDPSDYKDAKTKERIIKAKAMVAIKKKKTSDETRAEDEFMARLNGTYKQ